MSLRTHAVTETCPGCGQTVLATEWDQSFGVFTSTVRADPTPLNMLEQAVCVLVDRRLFVVTTTPLGARLLGDAGPVWRLDNDPGGAVIVPAHRCRGRFAAALDPPRKQHLQYLDQVNPPF